MSASSHLYTSSQQHSANLYRRISKLPAEYLDEFEAFYFSKHVAIRKLFQYATTTDIFCVVIGITAAILAGAVQPMISLLFGKMVGTMITFSNVRYNNTRSVIFDTQDTFEKTQEQFVIFTAALGLITIILVYISIVLLSYTSLRQMARFRSIYFETVLCRDIGWFDKNNYREFPNELLRNLDILEEVIGDKLSTFIFHMSIFVSGTIYAIIRGWKLALVCLIYLPVSITSVVIVSILSKKLEESEKEAYGTAAAIAEEVLSSIKFVVAYNGQTKELDNYRGQIKEAKRSNTRMAFFVALSNGMGWVFSFTSHALTFYYGAKFCMQEKDEDNKTYTVDTLIAVFFSITVASWYFSHSAEFFRKLVEAKHAATHILQLMNEPIYINTSMNRGKKFIHMKGDITFKNVEFHYETNKFMKVLRQVNLVIKSGETIALVGQAECGKCLIQLLQRFYDPVDGEVYIDDTDIKKMDLTWLRLQMGLVPHDPAMFHTTIAENIRFGSLLATRNEIIEAAKSADAHDFIVTLPNGYDTHINQLHLTNGQRLRIALARALIRKPKILLLDEPTTFMGDIYETQMEHILRNAARKCTTLLVSSSYSTVQFADRIIFFSLGRVVEQGTHGQLMSLKGMYFHMVTTQISRKFLGIEDEETELRHKKNIDRYQRESRKISSMSEDEKKMSKMKVMRQIMSYNRPEMIFVLLGCIASIICGAALPAYSYIFAEILEALSEDESHAMKEIQQLSLAFIITGSIAGFTNFVQWYFFSISGEGLTMRVRTKLFKALLQQEMSWFDKRDNDVHTLCNQLSIGGSAIQGAFGCPIGVLANSVSSLTLAMGVAFYHDWRLSLLNLIFIPLILILVYLMERITNRTIYQTDESVIGSSQIAVEAVVNIKSIASLGLEPEFHNIYLDQLTPHYKKELRMSHFYGLITGTSRSIMFFSYGVSIYYGCHLIKMENVNYSAVITVTEAILSGAWAMGSALSYVPNINRGIFYAQSIVSLLNRTPIIKDHPDAKSINLPSNCSIKFHEVFFRYPMRRKEKVVEDLTLVIPEGKSIALVGPTGCGKSTLVNLLLRFYDPDYGDVFINNMNIKEIKLASLRQNISLISSNPVLFNRTIGQNIAYGDNSREVPENEIIEAAKLANIDNFIRNLPEGYDTMVGTNLRYLSSTQKQRICIARAMIKKPKILLLNEITTMMDKDSEKLMLEIMSNIKQGRKTITTAHRLQTIKDYEIIAVFDKGRLREKGNHIDLMNKNALYSKLYKIQAAFD